MANFINPQGVQAYAIAMVDEFGWQGIRESNCPGCCENSWWNPPNAPFA
jgi:hypothetical protein